MTTLVRVHRSGLVALVLACSLLALAVGLWLGGHPRSLPDAVRDAFVEDDRALRAEVVDNIQENFYKPVDDNKFDDASIRGIIRSLDDRFSHYFDPKQAQEFRDSVEGEFEGVGLGVAEDRRGLKISEVFEGSPAARAGIHKDDVVTKVNGRSIAGVPADLATGRIKGEPGTEVTLTVNSGGRTRDVRLERARIHVPVVEGRIVERDGKKLGLVELASFTAGAHGALRKEIERLEKRGAQGILLDLRGNGGGILNEAVLVASTFLEDGRIVSTKGRSKPERVFEAEGDAIDEDVPVVVLVDRGSASASEIVTGALRDRRRATVVGTPTFGKGVFQEVKPLSNGGLLDLTVGSYYLPGGENISERGIKPAVRARDLPRTRRDEALPIALEALADRVR